MDDLIILTFREPLRGREQRAGYLPSDMLWGALYANDVCLQGTPMPTENLFRISSAFPYVAGEWLLPKPRVSAEITEIQQASGSSEKKKAKSLQYVRLSDFIQLAAGKRLAGLDEAIAIQRRALLPVVAGDLPLQIQEADLERVAQAAGKEIHALSQQRYGVPLSNLSQSERFHLLGEVRNRRTQSKSERQRNTQDRITQKTDTFMTESTMQPRVAFLLRTTSADQRERLFAALRLLGDRGIGGLRTQGSGQFEFEVASVPNELQSRLDQAGPQVLLGLTHPTQSEAELISQDSRSRYGLLRRGGSIDGTGLLRQDIWMLTEGSFVPAPLQGRVVNVAPADYAHPIWRSGLAVSIGVE